MKKNKKTFDPDFVCCGCVCESGLSAPDVWGGSPEEALTQKFSSNRKKLKKKEI